MINKFWKISSGVIFFISSCQFENGEEIISLPEKDSAHTEKSDSVITPADPFADSLERYFDNPMDFFTVKKNTQHMHTGYSKLLDEDLLHQGKDSGAIFYTYWAIEFLRDHPDFSHSLQFITRKPWTTKTERSYETDNEELIGIESVISWKGLGESDFVGSSVAELEQKFGEPQDKKNECLLYAVNDKILILHLRNEKVKWFKYYWLAETFNTADSLPAYFFTWNND